MRLAVILPCSRLDMPHRSHLNRPRKHCSHFVRPPFSALKAVWVCLLAENSDYYHIMSGCVSGHNAQSIHVHMSITHTYIVTSVAQVWRTTRGKVERIHEDWQRKNKILKGSRKVSRKTLAPRMQTKLKETMCSVQFIPLLVKYTNCGEDEGLSFHPGWANNYCCPPCIH